MADYCQVLVVLGNAYSGFPHVMEILENNKLIQLATCY